VLALVGVLFAMKASAQVPQTIEFDIERQRILDRAAVICPLLKVTLPSEDQTPWGLDECIEQFAYYGMKDFWVRHESEAARIEGRQRERDAADALKEP
jgi:hypothetical protein